MIKKRVYTYLHLHGWLCCAFLGQQLLLFLLIKYQIEQNADLTKMLGFTFCQAFIILTAPLLLKIPYLYLRFAWFDTLPKNQQYRLLNRRLGAYRQAQTLTEKSNLQAYARHYLIAGLALLLMAQISIFFKGSSQKTETKQPPSKDGGFGLRAECPDTHRLNDASLLRFSTK